MKMFSFAVSCPPESPVVNGNVTLATNGTVTFVEYTCADGYELVGASKLTCLTNGTWDNTPPQCCMYTRSFSPQYYSINTY